MSKLWYVYFHLFISFKIKTGMWTFSHINRSKFVFKTTVYYIYNKIRSNQTNEQKPNEWTKHSALDSIQENPDFFIFSKYRTPPTPTPQPPIHTHMRTFLFGKYLNKLFSLLFRIVKNILKRGCEHSSIKKNLVPVTPDF